MNKLNVFYLCMAISVITPLSCYAQISVNNRAGLESIDCFVTKSAEYLEIESAWITVLRHNEYKHILPRKGDGWGAVLHSADSRYLLLISINIGKSSSYDLVDGIAHEVIHIWQYERSIKWREEQAYRMQSNVAKYVREKCDI